MIGLDNYSHLYKPSDLTKENVLKIDNASEFEVDLNRSMTEEGEVKIIQEVEIEERVNRTRVERSRSPELPRPVSAAAMAAHMEYETWAKSKGN